MRKLLLYHSQIKNAYFKQRSTAKAHVIKIIKYADSDVKILHSNILNLVKIKLK